MKGQDSAMPDGIQDVIFPGQPVARTPEGEAVDHIGTGYEDRAGHFRDVHAYADSEARDVCQAPLDIGRPACTVIAASPGTPAVVTGVAGAFPPAFRMPPTGGPHLPEIPRDVRDAEIPAAKADGDEVGPRRTPSGPAGHPEDIGVPADLPKQSSRSTFPLICLVRFAHSATNVPGTHRGIGPRTIGTTGLALRPVTTGRQHTLPRHVAHDRPRGCPATAVRAPSPGRHRTSRRAPGSPGSRR
jgi:hypothetical protein